MKGSCRRHAFGTLIVLEGNEENVRDHVEETNTMKQSFRHEYELIFDVNCSDVSFENEMTT